MMTEKKPSTSLRLIIFLGMLTAIAPLSTDMYLPALPEVQMDFGVSTSLVQLTLTMTTLGMALGMALVGPLSDLLGRRRPLLVGMLAFVGATIGCVFAENIYLFLLCRFLAGFAGASGVVIARAVARDVCEGPELTRFVAVLMMVNGLAPIIAPIIGGQILFFAEWRVTFVLLTLIGIALAGATFVYRETLPREARSRNMTDTLRKFPTLLHDRYFLGHCVLQCFTFGAFFLISPVRRLSFKTSMVFRRRATASSSLSSGQACCLQAFCPHASRGAFRIL